MFLLVIFACEAAPRGREPAGGTAPQVTQSDGAGPPEPARTEEGRRSREVVAEAARTLPKVPIRDAAPVPSEPTAAGKCPTVSDKSLGVLTSPRRPVVGGRLHILAATFDDSGPLQVRVEREQETIDVSVSRRDGAPSSAAVTFRPASPGVYRIIVGRAGVGLACRKVRVARRRKRSETPDFLTLQEDGMLTHAWKTRRSWRPREEALFSAWLRELFHAPRGEELAFGALREALLDDSRNYLHDALGLGEDAAKGGLRLRPDCADAPYFLRAYFAWKRGLPFVFRRCSRGRTKAPTCRVVHSNSEPMTVPASWREAGNSVDKLRSVERFFRKNIGWGVHSGNGRVAHGDDENDFYPVELSEEAVRPGTIYADPYGHIFVVVELMAQRGGRPGVLYAIDGQPDGSITRKRFWAGNFMWNPNPSLGGSGFKRFRPAVRGDADEDGRRPVGTPGNRMLRKIDGYEDVDEDVGALGAEAFFDRMHAVVSPEPVDVEVALREVVDALSEAAKVRVTSVNNGIEYVKGHPGDPVTMPWGHAVFETSGPWENFSTPARDLRLLVAMDVTRDFVDRVLRMPSAFGIAEDFPPEQLRTSLQDLRERLLQDPARAIEYTRSNGARVTLTMAQLVARATALEVAYNPNDCVEVRWGAADGSEERSSCRRRASEEQQKKMEAYRDWFRLRQRPRRGSEGPDVPGVSRAAD